MDLQATGRALGTAFKEIAIVTLVTLGAGLKLNLENLTVIL